MPTRGSSTQRGYGHTHRRTRAHYAPLVAAGQAHCTELKCLMRSRWIPPTTPWDLAHDRTNGGYLGPAHRRCNRAEGATYGNQHRQTTPQRTWQSRAWGQGGQS